jgi:hypothetical protein
MVAALLLCAEGDVCCALQLAALSQVAKDVWGTMKRGYRPPPGAGYTAADYATAVDAILKSPYKAVNDEELEAVLGQQSLEAMVQANLLALRPYSHWAADIDFAAFGVDLDATVVTCIEAIAVCIEGIVCPLLCRCHSRATLTTSQAPAGHLAPHQ